MVSRSAGKEVIQVSAVETRLHARGLFLPDEVRLPPDVTAPFQWARVHDTRVIASGHGALNPDGSLRGPFGSVPGEVPLDQAQESAQGALLALLASVRRAVGDLDRVTWLSMTGFVNADRSFPLTTLVLNPASELVLELFGPAAGAHARVAPGVCALPQDLPVIIAAELELRSPG
jgi:hypothetical protein